MYSQRDPLWESVRLGTSRKTIGNTGCLVTVIAEFLRHAPIRRDPASLNRWLVNNGGFVRGNRFVFSACDPLGLHLETLRDWSDVAANVGLIRAWIRDQCHVAVEVNFRPWGAFTMHWVGVLSILGDDLVVHDPWMPIGSQEPVHLLPRYARPDWTLERAIYRAVAYKSEWK